MHSKTDLFRPRSCRRSTWARCGRPGFSTPLPATGGEIAPLVWLTSGVVSVPESTRSRGCAGEVSAGPPLRTASGRIPAATPVFPKASAGHRQARSPAIHSANGGRDAGLVLGLSRTNARHRARSPAVMVAAVVSRAPPLPCSRGHPFHAQSAGARRPAAQSLRPSPLRIGRRIRPGRVAIGSASLMRRALN